MIPIHNKNSQWVHTRRQNGILLWNVDMVHLIKTYCLLFFVGFSSFSSSCVFWTAKGCGYYRCRQQSKRPPIEWNETSTVRNRTNSKFLGERDGGGKWWCRTSNIVHNFFVKSVHYVVLDNDKIFVCRKWIASRTLVFYLENERCVLFPCQGRRCISWTSKFRWNENHQEHAGTTVVCMVHIFCPVRCEGFISLHFQSWILLE